MLSYPGFDPVAVSLGPLRVRWYGLMYVVGFLAAWWLARRRAREPISTWTPVEVDDLVFYAVFGVILGGRIGWLMFYGQQALAEDPSYWYKIWLGGMSFHGGLIGVLVALAALAWRRQRNFGDVLDFTAPLPALGFAAGRIGNFINGELWGKPTHVAWGFAVHAPDGTTQVLHPSQLYEACLEGLLLFAVLWWFTSQPRPRWAASGLFLAGYGSLRILIEFVRVPDVQLGYLAGGWLTMGMLLSLPMVLAGLGMLAYAYRARQPSGNYARAAPAARRSTAAR
jgi:phosphatidylglycerol---prolipoprotein diacylglyceryl transferase